MPFVKNWFSNSLPCDSPMMDETGTFYETVENYYQAHKSLDRKVRYTISRMTPRNAKRAGRTITIRSDWDVVKLDVMERALRLKFATGTTWFKKLMESEGPIIEWNNWGDQFWGKTMDGVGENNLGKILEKIRCWGGM